MREKNMKILGETIPLSNDYLHIDELKFLKDNPRVYACTHGEPNFNDLIEEEQQELIFKKLLEEPSVKALIPQIKRHGGLMEPILIRKDTMEVIEGNSRLAVYRKFHHDQPEADWEYIPCDIVSSLTEGQQAAFLNQIHVKGKTQWSAYEKANFAFVRFHRKVSIKKIAETFGETELDIKKRVKIISMMHKNSDNERSHFSHYEVLVRNRQISASLADNIELRDFLLKNIKELSPEESKVAFTAQELRDSLPTIISKPRVLRKYINGTVTLDDGFQDAKISGAHERVKQAQQRLSDITEKELKQLDKNALNSLEQDARKLNRTVQMINDMIRNLKDK